jgi:hypothetical protein
MPGTHGLLGMIMLHTVKGLQSMVTGRMLGTALNGAPKAKLHPFVVAIRVDEVVHVAL